MRRGDQQGCESTTLVTHWYCFGTAPQVYLHHYFGHTDVLPGVGAESRHLPSAHPLPAPYAPVIDGAWVAADPGELL